MQADRTDACVEAALQAKARQCRQNWNRRRRRRVNELVKKFKTDPRAVAEELKSTAFGLIWIIGLYQEMIAAVQKRGYLLPDELAAVLRTWGIPPEDKVVCRYEIPYSIQVYNLGATPDAAPAVLEEWLTPLDRAMEPREELLPEVPEDCTTLLLAVLEGLAKGHVVEEERLRSEVDEPDLQVCLKRAAELYDADGRRVKRSTAEATSRYHRAHKALFETLKRDAEAAQEEDDEDEDKESPPPPEARVEAGAPVAAEVTPHSQNDNPANAELSPQVAGDSRGSSADVVAAEARPFCDQKPSEGGAKPGATAARAVVGPETGGLSAGAIVPPVDPHPVDLAGVPPPVAPAPAAVWP